MIKIKKLNENAIIPTKANSTDAGYDLYAIDDYEILGCRRSAVKTGIAMSIPDGYVGLVWPRSGLAIKKGIDTLAGVIDSGYRGEIVVLLQNHGSESLFINKGDRIAQILFQSIANFELKEVQSLDDTDRGGGGFGSSGT